MPVATAARRGGSADADTLGCAPPFLCPFTLLSDMWSQTAGRVEWRQIGSNTETPHVHKLSRLLLDFHFLLRPSNRPRPLAHYRLAKQLLLSIAANNAPLQLVRERWS